MKKVVYILLFVLLAFSISPAQTVGDIQNEAVKIEAQPTKGFTYPYYLYVPKAMRQIRVQKQTHTILVLPNNAGKTSDDFAVHEADVSAQIPIFRSKIRNSAKKNSLLGFPPKPTK